MKRILAIVLLFAWIVPLGAVETATSAKDVRVQAENSAALPSCPAEALLTQVSQSDCCKGHKGVCGCRAGKIVCCDNTTSATCACHADSGVEN